MAYQVRISDKALRESDRIPLADRRRIGGKIAALAENPRPPGVEKMKGNFNNFYRIRSGDYRIIYQVRDFELVVLVVRIGHRKHVYHGL